MGFYKILYFVTLIKELSFYQKTQDGCFASFGNYSKIRSEITVIRPCGVNVAEGGDLLNFRRIQSNEASYCAECADDTRKKENEELSFYLFVRFLRLTEPRVSAGRDRFLGKAMAVTNASRIKVSPRPGPSHMSCEGPGSKTLICGLLGR